MVIFWIFSLISGYSKPDNNSILILIWNPFSKFFLPSCHIYRGYFFSIWFHNNTGSTLNSACVFEEAHLFLVFVFRHGKITLKSCVDAFANKLNPVAFFHFRKAPITVKYFESRIIKACLDHNSYYCNHIYLFLNYSYLFECMCKDVHAFYSACGEVRVQPARVSSLFLTCGSQDETPVVRLGGHCLYQLSHLVGLTGTFPKNGPAVA